jgi:hypothetical protein
LRQVECAGDERRHARRRPRPAQQRDVALALREGALFLSSTRMTRPSSARPISRSQIKMSPFWHQLLSARAVSHADTTRQEGAASQAYALH